MCKSVTGHFSSKGLLLRSHRAKWMKAVETRIIRNGVDKILPLFIPHVVLCSASSFDSSLAAFTPHTSILSSHIWNKHGEKMWGRKTEKGPWRTTGALWQLVTCVFLCFPSGYILACSGVRRANIFVCTVQTFDIVNTGLWLHGGMSGCILSQQAVGKRWTQIP